MASTPKSVMITGTSTGIGAACALHLDKLGWRVFAGVRRQADAEALKSKASSRLTPVAIDVADTLSISTAAGAVAGVVGDAGLDGLVNNAGVVVTGPVEFLPLPELRRQLEINVVGQVAVTQAFDENVVLLRKRTQWVQVDLGGEHEVYAILLWHEHKTPVVYRDVIVQVSDDPEFKTGVQTLFNNDQDNSSGLGVGTDREYFENYEGKLIDAKGVKARYVRLSSKGNTTNDLNYYVEVEVYGLAK
jgi:NAD(P)-dependent dehydrogenase (short-subunit alcohol dehydrogenase family)